MRVGIAVLLVLGVIGFSILCGLFGACKLSKILIGFTGSDQQLLSDRIVYLVNGIYDQTLSVIRSAYGEEPSGLPDGVGAACDPRSGSYTCTFEDAALGEGIERVSGTYLLNEHRKTLTHLMRITVSGEGLEPLEIELSMSVVRQVGGAPHYDVTRFKVDGIKYPASILTDSRVTCRLEDLSSEKSILPEMKENE